MKGPTVRDIGIWGYETFPNARRDWVRISYPLDSGHKIAKIMDWCQEQFGYDNFYRSRDAFYFDNEDDATLFKMRWM